MKQHSPINVPSPRLLLSSSTTVELKTVSINLFKRQFVQAFKPYELFRARCPLPDDGQPDSNCGSRVARCCSHPSMADRANFFRRNPNRILEKLCFPDGDWRQENLLIRVIDQRALELRANECRLYEVPADLDGDDY